jgi:VanZ family protein
MFIGLSATRVRPFFTFVARIAAWVLALTITVLSIVPPNLRPDTALPHSIEHASIFLATGVAFGLGYNPRNTIIGFLLVAFSAGIEIIQLFVPGRHARLSDFLIDALAITFGVASASLIPRKYF